MSNRDYFCALVQATVAKRTAQLCDGDRHAILVYVDCDDEAGPTRVVAELQKRGWRDVDVGRTKRVIDVGNVPGDDPLRVALADAAGLGFGAVVYANPIKPN